MALRRLWIVVGLSAVALAGGGNLDPDYGTDGIATSTDVFVAGIARQSDGSMLVAGREEVVGSGPLSPAWRVIRFDADGTQDTSFGVVELFADAAGGGIASIAVDSEDRVLLGGRAEIDEVSGQGKKQKVVRVSYLALVRLTPDGELDADFGDGGIVLEETSWTAPSAGAIAVQPDGKIVVAGSVTVASRKGIDRGWLLARFDDAGTLDSGFGTGGVVMLNEDKNDLGLEGAECVALQGTDIVVGGRITSSRRWVVRRFHSDGAEDASFGSGGTVERTGGEWPFALAVDADDRVVVTGHSSVVRYEPDGDADTGFGTGGVFTASSAGTLRTLELLADGNIAVGGRPNTGDGMFVLRLRDDGTLDGSFGSGGQADVALPFSAVNGVSLEAEPNGDLTLAASPTSPTRQVVVARVLGN